MCTLSLILGSELVELAEAVTIDDFLEFAVVVMTKFTVIIQDHYFAVFLGVRLPSRKAINVGIPHMGEGRPDAGHGIG